MSAVFVMTYVLLWAIVLLLAFAVLVLARQVGIIHLRIPNTGAATTPGGLIIGEPAPPFAVDSIDGTSVTIGSARERAQLLVFVSPACGACERLVPAINSVARSQSRTLETLVVNGHGDRDRARQFAKATKLGKVPMIASQEIFGEFDIKGTPYAIYLDEEGVVRAKGVVNTLAQVEGLIEAGRLRLTTSELRPGPSHQHGASQSPNGNGTLVVDQDAPVREGKQG